MVFFVHIEYISMVQFSSAWPLSINSPSIFALATTERNLFSAISICHTFHIAQKRNECEITLWPLINIIFLFLYSYFFQHAIVVVVVVCSLQLVFRIFFHSIRAFFFLHTEKIYIHGFSVPSNLCTVQVNLHNANEWEACVANSARRSIANFFAIFSV